MLNKNDPLVSAVQEVMKRNQAEREAARLVNEKFGIHDRKALPRERQSEWDSAYQAVLTEGVEALDEAKIPDNHKQAMIKTYGPGRVTASNGMIRHKDKYGETNSHAYDPTKKQPIGRHVGTITVDEEALDEKVKMTKQQFANLDGNPNFTANDLAHARKGTHVKKAAAGNLKEAIMNKIMKKLEEKAESQALQQAAGAALAAKRGDIPMSNLKGASKEMMSMSTKELEKFARTKHKGLPEKVDEGFNNRHGLSVTASAEKQAVADQLTERVGNPLLLNRAKARARLGDSGVRRPISGTNNLQTRLANMRRSAPALDPNRNIALDNPTTQSPMATAQKRQDMASAARQNRAGTNTFVAAARAEAQRRRQAGEPVLKAADVPGVNARDAQSKSDEVMAASRMANRNDLAQKARDLRAGTNTFVAAAKAEAQRRRQAGVAVTPVPSAAKAQSDEILGAARAANRNDLAQKAKDLRAGTNTFTKPKSSGAPTMAPGTKLNRPTGNYNPFMGKGEPKVDARAKGLAPIPSRPATGIGPQQAAMPAKPTPDAIKNLGRKSAVAPVSPAAREPSNVAPKPATTPMTTQTTQTTQPAPAAQAPAPVKKVAPAPAPAAQAPAPKRTAFQDMMRRAQSKSEPAGPRKDAQGLNVHSMTRPQPGKPGVRK